MNLAYCRHSMARGTRVGEAFQPLLPNVQQADQSPLPREAEDLLLQEAKQVDLATVEEAASASNTSSHLEVVPPEHVEPARHTTFLPNSCTMGPTYPYTSLPPTFPHSPRILPQPTLPPPCPALQLFYLLSGPTGPTLVPVQSLSPHPQPLFIPATVPTLTGLPPGFPTLQPRPPPGFPLLQRRAKSSDDGGKDFFRPWEDVPVKVEAAASLGTEKEDIEEVEKKLGEVQI